MKTVTLPAIPVDDFIAAAAATSAQLDPPHVRVAALAADVVGGERDRQARAVGQPAEPVALGGDREDLEPARPGAIEGGPDLDLRVPARASLARDPRAPERLVSWRDRLMTAEVRSAHGVDVVRWLRGEVGRLAAVRAGARARRRPPTRPLLVGLAPFDDAAVYKLTDDLAVVSTTDFFPPLVDDPSDFGAIAAANACSDVFAMGGRVVMALNISAFPERMPVETIGAILSAASEVVREAGGVVAGGHTIRSEEPIFGLAVQGLVHPGEDLHEGRRTARRRARAVEAARHGHRARRRHAEARRRPRSRGCAC